MKILVWINLAFGVLATGYGTLVVRGVLRRSLRGKWPTRFLACSLLASLAGLLPFTLHLAPIQQICMVTVYCTAVAIAAWLKFHLFGIWRPVFALSVTAVLYLDVVSWAVQLFTNSRLFATALAGPLSAFHVIQFVFAALFVVLGVLAVKKCHAEPTRSFRPERRPRNA
jgi:hypothetical protein